MRHKTPISAARLQRRLQVVLHWMGMLKEAAAVGFEDVESEKYLRQAMRDLCETLAKYRYFAEKDPDFSHYLESPELLRGPTNDWVEVDQNHKQRKAAQRRRERSRANRHHERNGVGH